MGTAGLNEATRAALARLTANEKDCLRRRLQHQTAKEMALDLGISPHAVEKRLKMARAKLGLTSSLDVARLLDASERYQQTAAQTTDLASMPRQGQLRLHRPLAIGALSMSLVSAAVLVFAALAPQAVVTPTTPARDAATQGGVVLIPAQVRTVEDSAPVEGGVVLVPLVARPANAPAEGGVATVGRVVLVPADKPTK